MPAHWHGLLHQPKQIRAYVNIAALQAARCARPANGKNEGGRKMHERRRGGWIGGLVLIMLGVVFLIEQFRPEVFGG